MRPTNDTMAAAMSEATSTPTMRVHSTSTPRPPATCPPFCSAWSFNRFKKKYTLQASPTAAMKPI